MHNTQHHTSSKTSSKWLSTVIAIGIALSGFAVSWGATRAEVNTLKEEVRTDQEKVRQLELQNAANTPILKNIEDSLKRMEKDLRELRDKEK